VPLAPSSNQYWLRSPASLLKNLWILQLRENQSSTSFRSQPATRGVEHQRQSLKMESNTRDEDMPDNNNVSSSNKVSKVDV
jgi:hypothetical protein